MFLCYSSGPDIGSQIFQGFRFAGSCERVFHNILDQVENFECYPPVDFYPFGEFLSESGMEGTFQRLITQARLPFSIPRSTGQGFCPPKHRL